MEKSPVQIQKDVHEHLKWDTGLHASNIRVNLEDGSVILRGTVPTYSERVRAENDAYMVAGVRRVENLLAVRGDVSRSMPSDIEIEADILDAFAWQTSIAPSSVTVSVKDGAVTLDGSVADQARKIEAESIAGSIRGVTSINNRLTPRKAEADDIAIRNGVIKALERTMGRASKKIGITVRDGIVTLDGKVTRCSDYHRTEEVARRTGGVAGVRNDIDLT